jgi:hypothetical protein
MKRKELGETKSIELSATNAEYGIVTEAYGPLGETYTGS